MSLVKLGLTWEHRSGMEPSQFPDVWTSIRVKSKSQARKLTLEDFSSVMSDFDCGGELVDDEEVCLFDILKSVLDWRDVPTEVMCLLKRCAF